MTEDVKKSAIWALPDGVHLIWRSWDEDEVIVYNRASGQTHLLDAFSAALLRQIEHRPGPVDEICERLAESLDLKSDEVAARAQQICNAFERLGLAEPETACVSAI